MLDMCTGWKTKEEEELRCRVLSGYAIICQEAGANMTGWRDHTHCGEALSLPSGWSDSLGTLPSDQLPSAVATTLTMASGLGLGSAVLRFKAASDCRQTPLPPTLLHCPVPFLLLSASYFCCVFSLIFKNLCVCIVFMCFGGICMHMCGNQRTGAIYLALLFRGAITCI